MNEGIYFADAELPFHVWVRERTGDDRYKWVLREARGVEEFPADPEGVPPRAEETGG